MDHVALIGKELSPSIGYTALTLFNLLRFPLGVFPEMINLLVRSRISLKRIEDYLNTPDVAGLPPKVLSSTANSYSGQQPSETSIGTFLDFTLLLTHCLTD
jgi:hypothetical protein